MTRRLADYAARHAATLLWLFASVLLATELAVFRAEVCGGGSRAMCMAIGAAETIVLLAPYWWLPRRWRALVLVPVWFMTVFYVVNILNFRFWGRLMPFMLATQAGNANGVLVHSALDVVRWGDMLYVAVPVVLTAMLCVRRVRRAVAAERYKLHTRLDATMLAAVTFLCGQYLTTVSAVPIKDKSVRAVARYKAAVAQREDAYLNTETLTHFLLFGQNIYCLYQFSTILSDGRVDLTQEQADELARFCAVLDPQAACMEENRGKNLILIIVESLDADIIGRKLNGREITPNLNALAHSRSSVSCLRVRPQIGEGNSSDGQLMYNTGLLPTSRYVGGADYVPALEHLPALSRQLPDSVRRVAVFADPGNGWNKMLAYRSYGYDRIYNSDSIRAHTPEGMSRDGAMFRYALQLVDSIGEPLHMQLLSIQMHAPYSEPVRNFTNYAGLGLTKNERRYINCTADFDRGLGYFVQGLKDRGMWDNTVLVIASDHNRPGSKRADGEDADIVFIAANAGRGESIDCDVNQVDVFPTILDIMGAPADAWRGVGRSMLGPGRGTSHPRQFNASDSLLRSDYFQ